MFAVAVKGFKALGGLAVKAVECAAGGLIDLPERRGVMAMKRAVDRPSRLRVIR